MTEFAEWINTFQGERLVLGSDLGQVYGPPPPEGIRMGIAGLLGAGVPAEYLEKMTKANPAKLLNLKGWGRGLSGQVSFFNQPLMAWSKY